MLRQNLDLSIAPSSRRGSWYWLLQPASSSPSKRRRSIAATPNPKRRRIEPFRTDTLPSSANIVTPTRSGTVEKKKKKNDATTTTIIGSDESESRVGGWAWLLHPDGSHVIVDSTTTTTSSSKNKPKPAIGALAAKATNQTKSKTKTMPHKRKTIAETNTKQLPTATQRSNDDDDDDDDDVRKPLAVRRNHRWAWLLEPDGSHATVENTAAPRKPPPSTHPINAFAASTPLGRRRRTPVVNYAECSSNSDDDGGDERKNESKVDDEEYQLAGSDEDSDSDSDSDTSINDSDLHPTTTECTVATPEKSPREPPKFHPRDVILSTAVTPGNSYQVIENRSRESEPYPWNSSTFPSPRLARKPPESHPKNDAVGEKKPEPKHSPTSAVDAETRTDPSRGESGPERHTELYRSGNFWFSDRNIDPFERDYYPGTQHSASQASHWFKNNDVSWDATLRDLVEYKAEYGDFGVSSSYDRKLSGWISVQRTRYSENKLSGYREERLNSIGFPWVAQKIDPWDKMYAELRSYKQRHNGSIDVPEEVGWGSEYEKLSRWTSTQREHYTKLGLVSCKLSQDRIDRLESIGFDWKDDDHWKRMYEKLATHLKKRKPTCRIKLSDLNGKLARWVRQQYKNCKQKHRKDLLKALGFPRRFDE
jgi:hypothetical protein